MSSPLPPEWYLEIEGKRSGPFTAEQVEGFLQDREILARHQVFSPRRPDQRMSAGEFVEALKHQREKTVGASGAPRGVPPGPPKAFHPPNKPRSMDERTGIIQANKAAAADPTQHLFDALQAVRERQVQTKLSAPTEAEWGTLARTQPARRSQLTLILTLAALLGVSVWGLNRLLTKKGEPTTASAPTVSETAPIPKGMEVREPPPAPPTRKAFSGSAPFQKIQPLGLQNNRIIPAEPRVRDRASETNERDREEEDRDSRNEARAIDRDPVEEFERRQLLENGGDGSIEGLQAPDPGVGGEGLAPLVPGDPVPIDPNEAPIE